MRRNKVQRLKSKYCEGYRNGSKRKASKSQSETDCQIYGDLEALNETKQERCRLHKRTDKKSKRGIHFNDTLKHNTFLFSVDILIKYFISSYTFIHVLYTRSENKSEFKRCHLNYQRSFHINFSRTSYTTEYADSSNSNIIPYRYEPNAHSTRFSNDSNVLRATETERLTRRLRRKTTVEHFHSASVTLQVAIILS